MKNKLINPKPTSAPGQMADKNAFAENLVELMMMRRETTHRFVSEDDLEKLVTDCIAAWENPQSEETSKILKRIFNQTHYLAVAGNWSEFLELLGVSPRDWDRSQEGIVKDD